MARAPEPDRDEFKGRIAEHLISRWREMPKWMTKAITEAITGNRGDPRPHSAKLSNGVSINVGRDSQTRAFDGSTGRRISDAAAIERLDQAIKKG